MKVFLSQSGPRARAVADTLHQWLPAVIQSIEPWMSAKDIGAGALWHSELSTKLAETRCGIICLTPENQTVPWILFEAGALSKTINNNTYVIPYLIDLEPSEILPSPLTHFQAKRASEKETWGLICTLNEALSKEGDKSLTDEQLKKSFERCWKELEAPLKNLPEPTGHQETRSQGDMLVEVLEAVRRIERSATSTTDDRLTPRTYTNIDGEIVRLLSKEARSPGFDGMSIGSIYSLNTAMNVDEIISSLKRLMERNLVRIVGHDLFQTELFSIVKNRNPTATKAKTKAQ